MKTLLARKLWWLIIALLCLFIAWGGWAGWEALRPPSPQRWATCIAKAKAAQSQQRFRLAARQFEKALAEAKRFGTADVRVADTLTQQGDCLLAAKYICKYASPTFTRRTIQSYLNFASTRLDQRFAEHISTGQVGQMYQQALSIYEQVYTPNDLRLAAVYQLFISRFEHVGDKQRMLQAGISALNVFERNAGSDLASLIPLIHTVAQLYKNKGDIAPIMQYELKYYSLVHRRYPPTDLVTDKAFHLVYEGAIKNRKFNQAVQLAKGHLGDSRSLAPNDRRLIGAYTDLGHALCLAGRYAESESAFQQGIAVCDHVFPKRFFDYPIGSMFTLPPEMDELYDNYRRLLQQTNRDRLADRISGILAD